MRLETNRLIIRTPKKSDWKDLVDGLNDLEVTRTLSSLKYPYKKKDALRFINKCIKESKEKKPEKYAFVIELKETGEVIGGTGIHKVDYYVKKGETGSWVAKKYWGRGIITEAKIAINDFAFNKLKLQRLDSRAFVSNISSNAMLKKFGYKSEGTARRFDRSKATGKFHDANFYGLLKEDWKIARKKIIKNLENRK